MDSTKDAASDRVYQDFDPAIEWVRDTLADTLTVTLPGFIKEQLKVQVTSNNDLKISGTRQLNDNKWSRFRKVIPIPPNYDTKGITAKFEGGKLYVRNPKLIVPKSPAPPEFSKSTFDQSTKPPIPPQETRKPTQEVPPKTQETQKATNQEPPKTSSKLEKSTNEDSSKTPKQTKQEPPKPSKPLQEPSKPEIPQKEEPSKPLEAPKSKIPPQETPKPSKEEPSKLEKPRTEKEEKEQAVRPIKFTDKAATSKQENAGKIEKAEALPEINESGSCKFVMENYMNSISGLMKEMKNARNATNIVFAILIGVVLILYIKNAVRTSMKSEN